MLKKLVSIDEATELLEVSRSTIYILMGRAEPATVQIGRRRLIEVASIKLLAGEEPANDA